MTKRRQEHTLIWRTRKRLAIMGAGLAACSVWTGAVAAATRAAAVPLAFPPAAQALGPIERVISALGMVGDQLILLPQDKSFAVLAKLPAGTLAAEVPVLTADLGGPPMVRTPPLTAASFGQGVAPDGSYRKGEAGAFKGADWRGMAVTADGERALLLDGFEVVLHEASPQAMQWVLSRTPPWDRIRPPRDRGGEATSGETAELRAAFKRAFLATPGLKAAGIAPLPAAWNERKGVTSYLLALRVAKFPLVLMECSVSEPSACQIVRQCLLEGAQDLAPEAVTGIAVSAARRLVLIGDGKGRRLVGFKFTSCLHVARERDYALPKQLKELTNIVVDTRDRLWVTTGRPDDYLKASVYVWPKALW